MLRISQSSTTDAQITLRLEGALKGQWVEELRKACARASGDDSHNASRLVLNLAEVSSIDSAGLALIGELIARGAAVTDASPYIADLLRQVLDR